MDGRPGAPVETRLTAVRRARALVVALLCALAALLCASGAARAATTTTAAASSAATAAATTSPASSAAETQTTVTRTVTESAAAGTPVLITDKTKPPAGYRLTADQALAIARKSPVVTAELKKHPNLEPYEYTNAFPNWQVEWFTHSSPQREKLQVYVDDDTGTITQAWTGVQVAWTMARGYPGAFGRIVNAWYIWLPFCLLFVAPFIRGGAGRRCCTSIWWWRCRSSRSRWRCSTTPRSGSRCR